MSDSEGEVVLLPKIEGIYDMLQPNRKLEQAEKKSGEALAAIGKIYQQIEKDLRGNRGAVSFFRRLQKMSVDKRKDFMRTFEPLCEKAGYFLDDLENDLVDNAGIKGDDEKGNDDGGDGGDDDIIPEVLETEGGKKSPLDAARAHLSGKPKPSQPGVH